MGRYTADPGWHTLSVAPYAKGASPASHSAGMREDLVYCHVNDNLYSMVVTLWGFCASKSDHNPVPE